MTYYVKIDHDLDDNVYTVKFLDFDECSTCGQSVKHALEMAQQTLHGALEVMLERNDHIPEAVNRSVFNGLYPIKIDKSLAKKILSYKINILKKELEAL